MKKVLNKNNLIFILILMTLFNLMMPTVSYAANLSINEVLKETVAGWYMILRGLVIVAMIILLLIIAIKASLTKDISDSKRIKSMLLDWLVGFLLILFMHVFMVALISINETLVSGSEKLGQQLSGMKAGQEISLYESAISKAYEIKFKPGTIGMILYIMLVYYAYKFVLVYLKRYVNVLILILLAPIVCFLYAFKKVISGKALTLKKWFKEFIYNVFLQSLHALMYGTLVGLTLKYSNDGESFVGAILCMVLFAVIFKVDKLVRKIVNSIGGDTSVTVSKIDKVEDAIKSGSGAAVLMGGNSVVANFGGYSGSAITERPVRDEWHMIKGKYGDSFDWSKVGNDIKGDAKDIWGSTKGDVAGFFTDTKDGLAKSFKETRDIISGKNKQVSAEAVAREQEKLDNAGFLGKTWQKMVALPGVIKDKLPKQIEALRQHLENKKKETIQNIQDLKRDVETIKSIPKIIKSVKTLPQTMKRPPILLGQPQGHKGELVYDDKFDAVIDYDVSQPEIEERVTQFIEMSSGEVSSAIVLALGYEAYIRSPKLGMLTLAESNYRDMIHPEIPMEQRRVVAGAKREKGKYTFNGFSNGSIDSIEGVVMADISRNFAGIRTLQRISKSVKEQTITLRAVPEGADVFTVSYKGKKSAVRNMHERRELLLQRVHAVQNDFNIVRNINIVNELEAIKSGDRQLSSLSPEMLEMLKESGIIMEVREKDSTEVGYIVLDHALENAIVRTKVEQFVTENAGTETANKINTFLNTNGDSELALRISHYVMENPDSTLSASLENMVITEDGRIVTKLDSFQFTGGRTGIEQLGVMTDQGLVQTIIMPDGQEAYQIIDSQGNIVKEAVDAEGNLVEFPVENGRMVQTIKTADGTLIQQIVMKDTGVVMIPQEYDFSQGTSKLEGLGVMTEKGIVQTIVMPDGQEVQQIIDVQGNIVKEAVDAEGNLVEFPVENGRIVQTIKAPDGTLVQQTVMAEKGVVVIPQTYEVVGERPNLAQLGEVTKEGIVQTVITPDGQEVQQVIDLQGHIIQEAVDAEGNVVEFQVNEGRKVQTIKTPEGTLILQVISQDGTTVKPVIFNENVQPKTEVVSYEKTETPTLTEVVPPDGEIQIINKLTGEVESIRPETGTIQLVKTETGEIQLIKLDTNEVIPITEDTILQVIKPEDGQVQILNQDTMTIETAYGEVAIQVLEDKGIVLSPEEKSDFLARDELKERIQAVSDAVVVDLATGETENIVNMSFETEILTTMVASVVEEPAVPVTLEERETKLGDLITQIGQLQGEESIETLLANIETETELVFAELGEDKAKALESLRVSMPQGDMLGDTPQNGEILGELISTLSADLMSETGRVDGKLDSGVGSYISDTSNDEAARDDIYNSILETFNNLNASSTTDYDVIDTGTIDSETLDRIVSGITPENVVENKLKAIVSGTTVETGTTDSILDIINSDIKPGNKSSGSTSTDTTIITDVGEVIDATVIDDASIVTDISSDTTVNEIDKLYKAISAMPVEDRLEGVVGAVSSATSASETVATSVDASAKATTATTSTTTKVEDLYHKILGDAKSKVTRKTPNVKRTKASGDDNPEVGKINIVVNISGAVLNPGKISELVDKQMTVDEVIRKYCGGLAENVNRDKYGKISDKLIASFNNKTIKIAELTKQEVVENKKKKKENEKNHKITIYVYGYGSEIQGEKTIEKDSKVYDIKTLFRRDANTQAIRVNGQICLLSDILNDGDEVYVPLLSVEEKDTRRGIAVGVIEKIIKDFISDYIHKNRLKPQYSGKSELEILQIISENRVLRKGFNKTLLESLKEKHNIEIPEEEMAERLQKYVENQIERLEKAEKESVRRGTKVKRTSTVKADEDVTIVDISQLMLALGRSKVAVKRPVSAESGNRMRYTENDRKNAVIDQINGLLTNNLATN